MSTSTTAAYGYVRVSGKGQLDGDGFARQEAAIHSYAKTHGIKLVRIFREEGVSGTVEVRPALAEMLVSLEQNGHGIKLVIIEKLDRLARDLMVQEAIIHDFKKGGFSLMSVMEGADLLENDASRKLIRQVFGAIGLVLVGRRHVGVHYRLELIGFYVARQEDLKIVANEIEHFVIFHHGGIARKDCASVGLAHVLLNGHDAVPPRHVHQSIQDREDIKVGLLASLGGGEYLERLFHGAKNDALW